MDKIMVADVNSKGYGKVYKRAMKDTFLSLTAKGLLSYLCAYAGNGNSAFPKREKVLKDMKLGKDTFSKHMAALETAGYITRHKTASGTVYEIYTYVTGDNGERIDLKKAGYGTIPKLVVLDIRLSAKAKAVYAYMCSYAGNGHSAYPHVGTILRDLKISKNSYYVYYNELINLGYISTKQRIDENGRYSAATYTLNEVVDIEGALAYYPKKDARKRNVVDNKPSAIGTAEKVISTDVENSGKPIVENAEASNAMSEKLVCEKTVSQNFGHANINNILTKNKSLSFDKEDKENNIRTHDVEADVERCSPFTRSDISEWMRYKQIMTVCSSWSKTKEILGHFSSPAEKLAYSNQCNAVVNEMAYQLQRFFSRKARYVVSGNKKYDNAVLRRQLMAQRDVLARVCMDIADTSGRIRSLRPYMKSVVTNLAIQGSVVCGLERNYAFSI